MIKNRVMSVSIVAVCLTLGVGIGYHFKDYKEKKAMSAFFNGSVSSEATNPADFFNYGDKAGKKS